MTREKRSLTSILKADILQEFWLKKYQIGRTTIQSWLRAYRHETGEVPQPQNRNVVKFSKETLAKKDMLKEIEMQLAVLKTFQKELERWDVSN